MCDGSTGGVYGHEHCEGSRGENGLASHLLDWTHEEMLDSAALVPAEDIGNLRLFMKADQSLLFLQITQKA